MKFSLLLLFVFAFFASFFYEDPFSILSKRVMYSFLLYLSIGQLYLFKTWQNENKFILQKSFSFKFYYYILFFFIGINLISDSINPAFNFITLLNNPNGLMMLVPIFAFEVGLFTQNITKLNKLFLWISIAFFIICILPLKPRLKYYEGNTCAYAILPLCIFYFTKKKYLIYCIGLIMGLIVFSFFSDIRTIFLRVILFFALLISLSVVKKSTTAKAFILFAVAIVIYQALANFQFYLDLFASVMHLKQFDADDTRSFLYTELFQDLNSKQLFIGKGFLGTYFSPYFLMIQQSGDTSGDTFTRFTSEVGFLQLLLKGGFTLFILYTFPLLYAAIKGIFMGYNNKLVFMLSIFIINEIFLIFFENSCNYNFNFFILFFISGFIVNQVNNQSALSKNNFIKHKLYKAVNRLKLI